MLERFLLYYFFFFKTLILYFLSYSIFLVIIINVLTNSFKITTIYSIRLFSISYTFYSKIIIAIKILLLIIKP